MKWLTSLVLAAAGSAFGAEFAWAPDGLRLASCEGRQVSVIDAGNRRNLLPLATDDCSILWSPSGNQLVVGLPNQALLLDAVSGRRVNIAGATDARFSPDGRFLSYVANGRFMLRSLVSGATRTLFSSTPHLWRAQPDWLYRNRLKMDAAYWWAPDSSAIAYLETERSPKLFPASGDPLPKVEVRIIDLAMSRKSPRTVQLPTGEAYLPQISWTPDSRALAIQRLRRVQTKLDVLLADASTGVVQTLLTESDPYWINPDPQGLQFLPDGRRFLWTSERTSFRHIYLYELSGKLVSQVTHGDWEVSSINAVDAHSVIYTSTQQSPVERHVYSTSLETGATTRLTTEHGWHTAIASNHGVLDVFSSSTHARTVQLINGPVLTTTPSNWLPTELTTARSHDGLDLHAMLIRPANFDPSKRYPAIVLAPSGPQTQIVRDASDSAEFRWAQTMARQGFVVFAVDGRGGGGRGRRFEEPIHYRLGGMELPDQLDGLTFLRRQGFVDMNRVGVYGSDYAGMITLGAMMHSPGLYRAGFAGSPITEWSFVDALTAERYLGSKAEGAVAYSESSPNEFARKLVGRMLVTADPAAPLDHIHALRDELEEKRKLSSQRATIEMVPHDQMLRRATRFFIQTLTSQAATDGK